MFDVVVFASGRGSNFAALLDAQRAGAPFAVRALLSDKPEAPALGVARDRGVPAIALTQRDFADRKGFDGAIFARAAAFSPRLIVLAGYMRVIDTAVIESLRGRVINIHPSLLPKYPGLHTHRRALEAGDTADRCSHR
jgi:phosphoribosylglycinamide formyltransferase 1